MKSSVLREANSYWVGLKLRQKLPIKPCKAKNVKELIILAGLLSIIRPDRLKTH